jgi:hypothetical protein
MSAKKKSRELVKTKEMEMRDSKIPNFDKVEDLTAYIKSLTDMQHDYGTCVYAMSMAATATFFHVANVLGVTGFQASMADMDILKRTRNINGPYMLIKAEDMLYPQYNIPRRVVKTMNEWRKWAKQEAKCKLADSNSSLAHSAVRKRWKQLAAGKISWRLGKSIVKSKKSGGKTHVVNIRMRNFDGHKTSLPTE